MVQVKTGQLADPHGFRKILVNRSTFVGATTTVLVALAWILPERRFHQTCLVIPTNVLPSVAVVAVLTTSCISVPRAALSRAGSTVTGFRLNR